MLRALVKGENAVLCDRSVRWPMPTIALRLDAVPKLLRKTARLVRKGTEP